MPDDFTWVPDWGASVEQSPAVLSAKFGDGYEQRRQNGINAQPATWKLRFSVRTDTEATALVTFLQTQGGVTSFLWTPPGGVQASWVCRKWQRQITDFGLNSVSCDFDEVYE